MELTKEQIQKLKLLAIDSANKKNLPIAAIILKDGKIVSSSGSSVITLLDPTAHAEVMAIRKACKKCKNHSLPKDFVLVSTFEPCLMCFSVAYWAGIRKIYYIISAQKYISRFPWILESKTTNKIELAKEFNEEVDVIKIDKYEKEFTKMFDEYVVKTRERK